jgi:hypothetical protein
MTKPKSILPHPEEISDDTAAVLTEFLFQLADWNTVGQARCCGHAGRLVATEAASERHGRTLD